MKQSYFLDFKVVECIKDYEDYDVHNEMCISIRSSDIIDNIRTLGMYDVHMIIFLSSLFIIFLYFMDGNMEISLMYSNF